MVSGNSNRSTCCYCCSAPFAQWICKQETLFFSSLSPIKRPFKFNLSTEIKKNERKVKQQFCLWSVAWSVAGTWLYRRPATDRCSNALIHASAPMLALSIVRVWVRLCVGNRVEIVSKHLCICVCMCEESERHWWVNHLSQCGRRFIAQTAKQREH